jgi:hypothetical protein
MAASSQYQATGMTQEEALRTRRQKAWKEVREAHAKEDKQKVEIPGGQILGVEVKAKKGHARSAAARRLSSQMGGKP